MSNIFKNRKTRNVHKLLCLMLPTLLLVGCVNTAAYREPITRFQEASAVVIEGVRVECGLANKRERNAEIDRLVARREKIYTRYSDDKEMLLFKEEKCIFSGKALAARMNALDALDKHGRLLLALASSDAPTKAKDAANLLGDAVKGLASSLEGEKNSAFKNTSEGFMKIAAEVIELVLNGDIRQALDRAVILSEGDVLVLSNLIKEDMIRLYERQRVVLNDPRVSAITEYNDEVEKPNPSIERLQKLASEIKKTEDTWDSLPLTVGATQSAFDAMDQAHRQLACYAKSSKNPQDLEGLTEAIDTFITRAKVVADAIKTIRGVKE